MKNGIKKILSLLLALCLLLGAVPFTGSFALAAKAPADDKSKIYTSQDKNYKYKKLDDENIQITEYRGSINRNMVYPSEIDGYKVLAITFEFLGNYGFDSITIPEGVEALFGQLSLSDSSLSIELPSSLKYIGRYTFAYMSFASINIPESLEGIDNYGFHGAEFPKGFEFNFPDGFKYLGMSAFKDTNISAVRFGKNAKLVDYCDYSPAGVSYAHEPNFAGFFAYPNPFESAKYLKIIEVAEDNPYLTATDNALYTKNLEYLIAYHANPQWMEPEHYDDFDWGGLPLLPEYDYVMPEGVRHIVSGAFSFCSARDITISSTVEVIDENAFEFFTARSLTFAPDSKLREIDYRGFYALDMKAPITLPKSLETIGTNGFADADITALSFETPSKLTTIYRGAFSDCDFLETVFLPNSLTVLGKEDLDHRYYGGDAFSDCRSLKTVVFEDNSLLASAGEDTFSNCPALKEIDFGENSALETIDSSCFKGSGLENLDLSGCKNLKKIDSNAFMNNKTLKSVNLGGTQVYEIDDSVFKNCAALETVTLPEDARIISENAFYGCAALKDINLDKIVVIKDSAFEGCALLNPEDIKRETKVTSDGVFFYTISDGEVTITDWKIDDSFTELNIPDKIENLPVTEIHRKEPYSYYTSDLNGTIKKVHIPASLRYISDSAFWDIRGVTEANVPESLEYIGENAFYYFDFLNGSASGTACEINLPNVKTIGAKAFYGTNVGAVNFGSSLTSIGDEAFGTCPIKEVTLPDSLTHLGKEVFNCKALEKISYGSQLSELNLIPEYYTHGELLNNLKHIEVRGESPYFYSDNGVLYTADKTKLLFYPQAKEDESYTVLPAAKTIGEYAFFQTMKLKSVTLPEGLETIEPRAFIASGLESVYIPANVKELGKFAFADCPNLKTAEFADGLEFAELFGTFSGCTALTKANFGKSTVVKSFSEYTFSECPLESIALPQGLLQIGNSVFDGSKFDTFTVPETVTELGYGAFRKSAVREVTLGSNIKIIESGTFYSCSNLAKINLNYIDGIGASAFKDCTALTQIDLTNVRYSDKTAFDGCVNLKKFYFTDEDITEAVVTEEEFQGNANLETIVVGNTVTEIQDYAFADCANLQSALIADSVTEISDTAFENCENLNITCTVGSYAMSYAEKNDIPYTTFVVAPIPDQEYTGSEITPELTVSAGGNPLAADCDYEAVYSDNIEIGSAKVNVLGLGDYSIFASLVRFNIVAPAVIEIPDEPEIPPVIPEEPVNPETPESPDNKTDEKEGAGKADIEDKPQNNGSEDKNKPTEIPNVTPDIPADKSEVSKTDGKANDKTDGDSNGKASGDSEKSSGIVTEDPEIEKDENPESEKKAEKLGFWQRLWNAVLAFFSKIKSLFA